jgi:DNA-binding LacI/PurR family transcriptional regulator
MSTEPANGEKVIAVLVHGRDVSSADTAYYTAMLDGVMQQVRSKGFSTKLIPGLGREEQAGFLAEPPDRYAGIIVSGALYSQKDFVRKVVETFEAAKVILDHHFDDIPMHSVQEDAPGGMRELTEFLVSLGHEEIAYVGKEDADANPWKLNGIRAALDQHRLALRDEFVVGGCWTEEQALRTLEGFADLDLRPTAVICHDDHRALRVKDAAERGGLTVPGHLSIAGYGDAAARIGRDDDLTSVQFDHIGMGKRAADLACGDPNAEPESVMVPCKLVVRGSTGPPPGER